MEDALQVAQLSERERERGRGRERERERVNLLYLTSPTETLWLVANQNKIALILSSCGIKAGNYTKSTAGVLYRGLPMLRHSV